MTEANLVYREARADELDAIAELTALAFETYPLFEGMSNGTRNERGVDEALFALQRAEAKLYLQHHACLVATMRDEIICAALLENPRVQTTREQFMEAGGGEVALLLGEALLGRFMRLANETTLEIRKNYRDLWYVDTLAVCPQRQGQRLGSRMLQEGITPFVKAQGASQLTLATNTRKNVEFYLKNGFRQIGYNLISCEGVHLENWEFLKEI